MATIASPKVATTLGLRNVVFAPLTEDTTEGTTYGDVQALAGAIEATISPENKDPDILYADDIEFDTLYADPKVKFTAKMADIPLVIQEMLFANTVDDNGVLIRTAQDSPPYFAVGFKSQKSNNTYRYVWLYKVRATPMKETYATKEGDSVTRQNGEIEFTAIKRTSDGRYQAIADEGEGGFTPEKGKTFLDEVYEATFTTTAS